MFRKIVLHWLIALVLSGISITHAQHVPDEAPPKNQLNSVVTEQGRGLLDTRILYSVSGAGFSSWNLNGWHMDSGAGVTTGVYQPNAVLRATSPFVSLPQIASDEMLRLSMDEYFSLESDYDFGQVLISADSGASWRVARRNTGKTGPRTTYMNISGYAGKTIQFALELSADASFESTGWTISGMELEQGKVIPTLLPVPGYQPAAGANSRIQSGTQTLEITAVHDDNFPEAVFVDFVYNVDGEFESGLSVNDLIVHENGSEQLGCLRLWGPQDIERAVDVVILMDNSGSMGDEQAAVLANIEDFVDNLSASGRDSRFALVRFGQSGSPIEKIEAVDALVYPVSYFTGDVNIFKTILLRNNTSGSIERGYEALSLAAGDLSFRPNADKVFILITDENATGSNLGPTTREQVISQLNAGQIRVYSMIPSSTAYDATYGEVSTRTNGKRYDILASMDDILTEIGGSISNKYTLRYCPGDTARDGLIRNVRVALKEDTEVKDTGHYTPAADKAYITRMPATASLDYTAVPASTSLRLEVVVDDPSAPFASNVDIYIAELNGTTFTRYTMTLDLLSPETRRVYFFEVPAIQVFHPGFKYYVVADYANGDLLKTPSREEDFFAWTVAVLPNEPPEIDVLSSLLSPQCANYTLQFTVSDLTIEVADIAVYYRPAGSPAVFHKVSVGPVSNTNVYSVTVPASYMSEQGLEVYITAGDNFGALGHWGTASEPRLISTAVPYVPSSVIMPLHFVNLRFRCDYLKATDEVRVYYIDQCGFSKLGGGTVVGTSPLNFTVPVSGHDGGPVKNGFEEGETIVIKVIRDGVDYTLPVDDVTFEMLAVFTGGKTLSGRSLADIGVLLVRSDSNMDIEHEDLTPSLTDNTDFGAVSSPVSRTFRLRNTGCDSLDIRDIVVSDEDNFSVVLPTVTRIAPDDQVDFSISYQAGEDADAIARVFTNGALSPYRFAIQGRVAAGSMIGLNVFPNPAEMWGTNVAMDLPRNGITTIAVYDLIGTLKLTVYHGYLIGYQNQYIGTSALASGTYIVRVTTDYGISESAQFIVP